MNRPVNFFLAVFLLPLLLIPIVIILIILFISQGKPVFYWSKRIGKDGIIFSMPKFRSMHLDSPEVATHLFNDPNTFVTPIGRYLRKTSLDELPQIWSIIIGNMNFVGPRPALFNQNDLIDLRVEKGVDKVVPGITGWAQINGRDELLISDKVILDAEYMKRKSFMFDMKILWLTILKVLTQDKVSH